MATVQKLLNAIDDIYPNAMSNETKVRYMNMAMRGLSPYFGLVVEDNSLVTVIDQDAYNFPAGINDVAQIIRLAIGTQEVPGTRYGYVQYYLSKRDDDPMIENSYFQIIDSTGAKKLCIYPVPTIADLPIVIRYHKALTELSATSLNVEPEFDSRFHDLLVFYCVHQICATGPSPDTLQADIYMQKYDDMLAALWKFQMEQDSSQKNRRRDNRQWHKSRSFGKGF